MNLEPREALMKDIASIIDQYFDQYSLDYDSDLVQRLCNAVCKHFPTTTPD